MTPPSLSQTDFFSCPDSCHPLTIQDHNISFLLHICYIEWVIMIIVIIMILTRLITNLEDEEWVWFMICSGILLIFSLIIGSHKHTIPSYKSQVLVQHSSRSDKGRGRHPGMTREEVISRFKAEEQELIIRAMIHLLTE
jgi:hypothetical protein